MRGRPPNKGACREGPEEYWNFEIQQTKFGILGSFVFYEGCDPPQALRQRRTIFEKKRSTQRNDQNIRPGIRSAERTIQTAARASQPGAGGMVPDVDFRTLPGNRKLPPWKPLILRARDWVSDTRSGVPLTGNRTGITTPAHHPKNSQPPKSGTGELCLFVRQKPASDQGLSVVGIVKNTNGQVQTSENRTNNNQNNGHSSKKRPEEI